MNEKPILFSGPMVRSILEGKKTQTRRIVNPQPEGVAKEKDEDRIYPWPESKTGWRMTNIHNNGNLHLYSYKNINCKYGKIGDRLWVRETFSIYRHPTSPVVHYRADCGEDDKTLKWKPSIFMPRWASRINLEVTGVRVERLQDISEEDAIKEGVYCAIETDENCTAPSECFKRLWESINGAESWKQNPWVWVVEFRKV